MEDDLHFYANGRQPQLFRQIKDDIILGKWKTTSIHLLLIFIIFSAPSLSYPNYILYQLSHNILVLLCFNILRQQILNIFRASRTNSDANDCFSTDYSVDNFSSRYNYYDGNKHGSDYLYPITKDVVGSWKHYNLSSQTLNERNKRSTSPLVSRELDRQIYMSSCVYIVK